MEFQVLSHAGLLVKSDSGKTLICDPWLIGSSYWRSWWNYPPVNPLLIEQLSPDYIYLTHIHWDHFHGPSLNRFSKETCIVIPKGNYKRMRTDLERLGFHNIIELKHGERMKLDDDFIITSYQVWMFLDSALMIECNGVLLLNLNDSKHMGLTLRQIINNHKEIDFVFRSHSSANERLSYSIADQQDETTDDITAYIRDFANTVRATGARFAIPFASNHCHLHKDSIHFNQYIQHPELVKEYFSQNNLNFPQVEVMVSGDSWNSATGFHLTRKKWFSNREFYLEQYLAANSEKLAHFYRQEDNTTIDFSKVEQYFKHFSGVLPFFVKPFFRKTRFTYVLKVAGSVAYIFEVDISRGIVRDLNKTTPLDYESYPVQIHTTAYIFLKSIQFRIFSHMCIGKRVFYQVTHEKKRYMEALNQLFNFYEYDMLPLHRNLTLRSIQSWTMRWREIILYLCFARDIILRGAIDVERYLPPRRHTKAANAVTGAIQKAV